MTDSNDPLSLQHQEQIDAAADEFERQFRKGERPRIELFLQRYPQLSPHMFQELLALELELRRSEGERPEFDEYRNRFPQLVDSVEEAFGAHRDFKLSSDDLATTESVSTSEEMREWIGPYKILQPIGHGGMGQVYMAEQLKPVRRRVALKIIKTDTPSKEILARFEAERQALAMMDHQNIAKVLDAGITEDGRPYFAMELVKGIPITEYCDRNKLTPNKRLELFVQACRAIQHAHQKGIIHRDIKPSNLLVTSYDGKPVAKVIDFGLSKALYDQTQLTDKTLFTQHGQVIGTLEYMSPEQAEMNATDVDTRTDVYSLGVILYELLTGSTPIGRKRLHKEALDRILWLIREEDVPRPSARLSDSGEAINGISEQRKTDPRKLSLILKGELDWIAIKALDKDRTRRYDGPAALADDVQRFLNNDVIEARPPSFGYRIQKAYRRNRTAFITAASIVLLMMGGLTAIGNLWLRALEAEQILKSEAETARTARSEAESTSELLEKEQTELRKQLRLSKSMRLTALAQGLGVKAPITSLLLNAEAASETIAADDGIVPAVHQSLRDGLKRVSGLAMIGHEGAVTALSISPDGSLIATGGEDSTVRTWRLPWTTEGLQSAVLGRHNGPVSALAFSGDGRHLASGSADGTTRIWALDKNLPSSELLSGHSDGITSIAFSNSRKLLVTGSKDATLRIWKIGQAFRPILQSSGVAAGAVSHLILSPDEKRVYATSSEGDLQAWDLEAANFEESRIELHHRHESMAKSFSISAESIIAAAPSGEIRRWKFTPNKPIAPDWKQPEWTFDMSSSVIEQIELPDDFVARVDRAQLRNLLKDDPDRDLMVKLIQDNGTPTEPRIAMLSKAVLPGSYAEPTGKHFFSSASSDGRWIGAFGARLNSSLIHGDFQFHLTKANYLATTAAFSEKNQWLAVGMANGAVRLFNLQADASSSLFADSAITAYAALEAPEPQYWPESKSMELTGNQARVDHVAITPDGKWAVAASADGMCRLWDLQSADPNAASPTFNVREHDSVCDPSGRWYVRIDAEGRCAIVDLFSKDLHESIVQLDDYSPSDIPRMADFPRMAVSHDVRWIANRFSNGTISIWDRNTTTLRNLPRQFHVENATGPLQFMRSKDRQGLAIATDLGLTFHEMTKNGTEESPMLPTSRKAGNAVQELPRRGTDYALNSNSTSKIVAVGFAGESGIAAVAFANGELRIIDVFTGKQGESLASNGFRDKVDTLHISNDGRCIVAGSSSDVSTRIWKLADSGLSATEVSHEKGTFPATIDPNGRWLATGGDDGSLQLWDLTAKSIRDSKVTFMKLDGSIIDAKISPDGRWLVTTSRDKTTRLWDLSYEFPQVSQVIIAAHPDEDTRIVSASNRWLAIEESEAITTLFDLDLGSLVERAKRNAGKELTPHERSLYLVD